MYDAAAVEFIFTGAHKYSIYEASFMPVHRAARRARAGARFSSKDGFVVVWPRKYGAVARARAARLKRSTVATKVWRKFVTRRSEPPRVLSARRMPLNQPPLQGWPQRRGADVAGKCRGLGHVLVPELARAARALRRGSDLPCWDRAASRCRRRAEIWAHPRASSSSWRCL